MSANLNNPAAIPPKGVRAERGRYIAEAQVGGVGAWDWNPTPAGEPIAGATLVKVKNTGSNAIKRWEACSVADTSDATEFFEKTFDCSDAINNGCGHGRSCDLGVCGTWPTSYEEVYDKAYALEPVVFQVGTNSPVIPKPGDLGGWLVAAEDIAVSGYGMAYAAGIHYAMVWDKNDLLDNGPELRFVDLPEHGAAYDTDDSSPTINLPLQVRANGRARVLAYDRLEYTSIGAGVPWPMTKVRLALIQRANHFTYPTIPCTLTGAAEVAGSYAGRRGDYNWAAKHDPSLTQAQVATALNLTETNNDETTIQGLTKANLDACFGVDDWDLQNAAAGGMEVMMSFCIDGDGKVQPYFALQNQVIPA